MNLPSRKECQQFWDTYATPQHIREHMKQVSRVAVYIAGELQAAGEHVTIDLVERAALLHDTIRVTDWETLSFDYFPMPPSQQEIDVWKSQRAQFAPDIPHSEVNYMLFKDAYPELAHVIRMHSIGSTPLVHTGSLEEKVVNYADRRVAHDRIVTVAERLQEAEQRYTNSTARTHNAILEHDAFIVESIFQLEQELCSRIGHSLDVLPL